MLIKQMPARVESLHELLTFIRTEAEKRGFSESALNRIELVVEEALVNVFVHGYARDQGEVEIRCLVSDDPSLTIEIRDAGVSFDPLSLAAPDVESDLTKRRIGGMGVFFIRKMTDKVAYRREGDSNVLTMTFLNR
ncbi:MAG: ATP-binding protein [Deltaproteobacteria bacterium HGW-Deltaproteobacteria-6]|jgi:anti-sigma regulatory factor (Ser/Thr protein kinase)|nr:MAG: ATP-binding protein [Deltaproteobacteria bacterium HGW-Deltaproteobacteria-6]